MEDEIKREIQSVNNKLTTIQEEFCYYKLIIIYKSTVLRILGDRLFEKEFNRK